MRRALLSLAGTFLAFTLLAVAATSASAVTVPACPPATPYRTGLYSCSGQKPAQPYVLPPGTVVTPRPEPGQVGWQVDEFGFRARHASDVSFEVSGLQAAARRPSPVIYVVAESRPADALAALPLIAKTGGALYTANRHGGVYINSWEARRFGFKRAVVIGTVPASTIAGLRIQTGGLPITQINAGTTQDTSALLAATAYPTSTAVYVTTADNVTDAAVLASAAARSRTPLFVVPRTGFTPSQRARLRSMGVSSLILGPDVQGETLASLQAQTTAIGQPISFRTAGSSSGGAQLSIDLARSAFAGATTATVTATNSASGAVVLAAHAAVMGQPLILKSPQCTPAVVSGYLNGGQFRRANVITVAPAVGGLHQAC